MKASFGFSMKVRVTLNIYWHWYLFPEVTRAGLSFSGSLYGGASAKFYSSIELKYNKSKTYSKVSWIDKI